MVLSGVRGATERYEVQWRLARALFFLGQEAGSRDSSRELYSAGIEAGDRAVSLNSERVEGHFWLGVNLALFAETNRGFRGTRAIRRARLVLERSAAINETYHDAGPLRVLGRLAHRTPRILGGNLKQSRKLFDRALKLAPSNTVTLIYAAEQSLDSGDRQRAKSLLHRVLECPLDGDWLFENTRDRKTAATMLETLGNH